MLLFAMVLQLLVEERAINLHIVSTRISHNRTPVVGNSFDEGVTAIVMSTKYQRLKKLPQQD